MGKKSLQLQQLNSKMIEFSSLKKTVIPSTGWMKVIRTSLGLSLQQLGEKLSITKQSVKEMEDREREGSISLKTLKEFGKTMDMKLVYGFVPNDGSLEALIERKALELATKIVKRTSHTMKLEDQENSKKRIEKAIQERAAELKNEMPNILWD